MAAAAIKGTVERYISKPREDGFAILAIRTQTGRAKICGKGLAGLNQGQMIEARGVWKTHQRFGEQFVISDVREIVPEDGIGLIRWLMQSGIPGVGEATARKLVTAFGEKTIERIAAGDEHARKLLGDRFPEAQRVMIMNRAEHAFGPLLAEHDIGPTLRAKIFKEYGLETARRIEEDPYQLIADVEGIAFATADRIAQATGVDQLSRSRLVAAAIDALRSAANDGHTALDAGQLRQAIEARTAVKGALVEEIVKNIDHPSVVATVVVREGEPQKGWALRKLDRAENMIAELAIDKLEAGSLLTARDAAAYVALAEARTGLALNDEQRKAAETALASSLSIITGGPGTGKTTTLRVICVAWSLAAADGWVSGVIKLAAPTGKASQRMKEATSIEAATLHRLLEVDSETGSFVHNETNPLKAGLIAVDETSMADVLLAASFARAWGEANILLIGDPDQLASVGPGRVLGDLIDSGVIPVTRLVQIRRQEEGSAIALGAEEIRQGRMPDMAPHSDLVFIEEEDNAKIAEMISALHAAYVEDGCDVQVLTPGHQSEVGTIALNKRLQEEAGHQGEETTIASGQRARAGDKIIQLENNHDAQIYNGDSGRIRAVSNGAAEVRLGERTLKLSADMQRQIGLAYALSVHKSQGSEYDVVIMPLTVSHWTLLRRTLVYTGLTRARQTCIIIGSKRALRQAISNDDARSRCTTLQRRLVEMAG